MTRFEISILTALAVYTMACVVEHIYRGVSPTAGLGVAIMFAGFAVIGLVVRLASVGGPR